MGEPLRAAALRPGLPAWPREGYLLTGKKQAVVLLMADDSLLGFLDVEDIETIVRFWRRHGVKLDP